MAWIIYEGLDFETGRTGKSGKKYDCYVMRGIKKGFPPEPDAPYEKVFFENSATTIIEKGVARPNVSIVSFLQKGCKPGDMISINNVRKQGRWEVESIENKTTSKGKTAVDYTPLGDDELATLRDQQMPAEYDPTRPAAPATPQMAPLNYNPAQ